MSQRPNIVLILTDEQHRDSLGCYGNRGVQTPHTDRIAAEGVRFDHAFCCSAICSPSRAALFTGQLPHRFGDVANDLRLPSSIPTLANRLCTAGYRLGFAGKWHIDCDSVPTDHAFEGKNFPGYGLPKFWMEDGPPDMQRLRQKPNPFYESLMDRGLEVPSVANGRTAFDKDRPRRLVIDGLQTGPVEASVPYFVAEETVGLIDSFSRRESQDGAPFFVWTNFWGPHNPCYIPEPYYSMYDPADIPCPPGAGDMLHDKPRVHERMSHYWGSYGAPWDFWQEHIARYLGYCTLIDDQIGRIEAALERNGQLDNTLIVVAADHGDMLGRHQLMDKGVTMYDDIYRIPLIIRGPGIAAGTSDAFVYLHDLFPTLLEAAGVDPVPVCDGQSILPLLQPGSGEWPDRDAVFGTFDRQIFHYPQRMIRTRTHKFVYNTGDICELYDLENDPHELTNRIDDSDYRDIKADLSKRLLDHLLGVQDSLAGAFSAVRRAI